MAAQLRRKLKTYDVAIVEPSTKHYYQPLWTLVGAGVFPKEQSERAESAFIPQGADWIREHVAEFHPERELHRDAAGAARSATTFSWSASAFRSTGARSRDSRKALAVNRSAATTPTSKSTTRGNACATFKGGTALFTMPNTAVKCGGAPQKIMYLADDHFRRSGVREKSQVIFASAQGSLFAVEKYRKTLEKVAERKAIDLRFKHNLVELKPDQKEAIFEHLDTHERITIPFDMIHVTPPMSAPDIIKSSPLANAAGWMDVDKYTLQHPKFPNVFPIGDCSGLPTSKTGAAIRKQAPVLVKNLVSAIHGEPLTGQVRRLHFVPDCHGLRQAGAGRVRLRRHSRKRRFPSISRRSVSRCICSRPMPCRDSIGMACCAAGLSSDVSRSRKAEGIQP